MLKALRLLSLPALLALLLVCPVSVRSQSLKQAILLTKSEQFNEAATLYKQLIRQAPADGDNYYFYGISCLRSYFADTLNISYDEKADSARSIFEAGIRLDPANPINFSGLAVLKLIKRDFAGARAEFDKAVALLPSKANKQIKMAPERQAMVLINMAEAFVIANVHDTATAFDWLRKAEKLDAKNPKLYFVRGDAYFYLLNDGSKAIANYNAAKALEPNSPEATLRIGQLWLRARQYTTARNYYQEVVKMDSMFAPAYRELGSLLARAGQQEEAKKNFSRFLELTRNTAARKQYVNTLIELKEYEEAINQLNEILKVDNTDNDVNRALAYSYYETQQYEKGLQYIRNFIANAKTGKIRSLDYTYYGRLLAKMKLDSLAPEQLVKAYEMDSSKIDLLSEAAVSYTKVKKFDKARDLYERKIAMQKAGGMDYYNLGKVYYSLQDFVKADTNLAVFNRLQPDYIPGYTWLARAKSNLDILNEKSLNTTGYAIPVYNGLLEKTQSDTVKYMKDRFEAFDYLAFYYYSQFSIDQKDKESAQKAFDYYNRMLAVNPNSEKAATIKPVIDLLKGKLK